MDEIGAIVLNGVFGLFFAIIGYLSVIKAAQIRAEADRQKKTGENSLASKSIDEEMAKSNKIAKDNNEITGRFSWKQVPWHWWAFYAIIIFLILIFPILYSSNNNISFMFMLLFIFIGIPAMTMPLATLRPIPWNYAMVFILIVYLLMFVIALSTDAYVDLYEDVPLWAWTFANVAGVVVISIQREQSNMLSQ
jgi:hypothetical protein